MTKLIMFLAIILLLLSCDDNDSSDNLDNNFNGLVKIYNQQDEIVDIIFNNQIEYSVLVNTFSDSNNVKTQNTHSLSAKNPNKWSFNLNVYLFDMVEDSTYTLTPEHFQISLTQVNTYVTYFQDDNSELIITKHKGNFDIRIDNSLKYGVEGNNDDKINNSLKNIKGNLQINYR